MKLLVAFLIVIGAALTTLGQNTEQTAPACSLTVSQAPQVRGLRLGMSLEEFLALFPGNRTELQPQLARFEDPQNYGFSGLSVRDPLKFAGEAFKGIAGVSATFVDKTLASFAVEYQNTHWANVDEFIDKLGEFFPLPKAATWSSPQDSAAKQLHCRGIELFARIAPLPTNSPQTSTWGIIVLPNPLEQARQRKREADAKIKQAFIETFKP